MRNRIDPDAMHIPILYMYIYDQMDANPDTVRAYVYPDAWDGEESDAEWPWNAN